MVSEANRGTTLRGHDDERLWRRLGQIRDPEIPCLSILDLGIVRAMNCDDDGIEVVITPTYCGCPAMAAIEAAVREELAKENLGQVKVRTVLSPAWTSDWISPEGRAKLRAFGIAPPGAAARAKTQTMRFIPSAVSCPRCGSANTERLTDFGSTACKALYRCRACGEPFDYFKPL